MIRSGVGGSCWRDSLGCSGCFSAVCFSVVGDPFFGFFGCFSVVGGSLSFRRVDVGKLNMGI